jgi:hypothetical protein
VTATKRSRHRAADDAAAVSGSAPAVPGAVDAAVDTDAARGKVITPEAFAVLMKAVRPELFSRTAYESATVGDAVRLYGGDTIVNLPPRVSRTSFAHVPLTITVGVTCSVSVVLAILVQRWASTVGNVRVVGVHASGTATQKLSGVTPDVSAMRAELAKHGVELIAREVEWGPRPPPLSSIVETTQRKYEVLCRLSASVGSRWVLYSCKAREAQGNP